MIRSVATILLLLLIALSACGQGEPPIAALGGGGGSAAVVDGDGDGRIDDAPDGVNDIFSVDDLQALADAGLDLYLGDEPPTVSGSFLADSLAIDYDDLGYSGTLLLHSYTFYNQTDEGGITVGYYSTDIDSDEGTAAYITGADSCFSAFAVFTGYTPEDDCDYERATVISGCLEEGGIADFMFGFIMTATDGDCSQTLPLGHMRIIAEADGFTAPL